jgi:hypothetical protein
MIPRGFMALPNGTLLDATHIREISPVRRYSDNPESPYHVCGIYEVFIDGRLERLSIIDDSLGFVEGPTHMVRMSRDLFIDTAAQAIELARATPVTVSLSAASPSARVPY